MYPFERLNKVIELLKEKGQIKIGEAATHLGVSFSTLHRDLDRLEEHGIIEKVRGGAVYKEKVETVSHFTMRLERQVLEKTAIAEKALQLIDDDSCVFIDHSTTSVYLAKEIAKRDYRNLIILTNSLVAPEILADAAGVKVLLTGGEANHELEALGGRWVLKSFENINVHKIFLSVGAVSPEKGFMTQLPFIHEIFPEVFLLPQVKVVMVDNSKFYKVATFHVGDIKQADLIVTDKPLAKELLVAVEKKGPQVIC